LFVALHGQQEDGIRYVLDACTRGASAIAVDRDVVDRLPGLPPGVARIGCRSAREFLADAAAGLARHPSEKLKTVAVTGTSGKTTTTFLLEAMWRAAGESAGVIGTIDYRYAGEVKAAPLTTPDAAVLQELLAEMVDAGVSHVALEASSHALALDRLRATRIDVGVFTNFARDHLDFHIDAERYFAAKARLFGELLPASGKQSLAVLNADDARVMSLAASSSVPVVTFGVHGDARFEALESDLEGSRGTILLGDERIDFVSPLVGTPHLANILAASAAAWQLGIPAQAIARGIASLGVVPGRLEKIDRGQPFAVLVDYAHKPDALERTLASLRALASGRLIVVFGCGGDRDSGKRPVMGAIAARLADVTIVTSDNPRTEEPMAIIDAIEAGVRDANCTRAAQETLGQVGHGVYAVVPERRAAICKAIEIAKAGDLVLIAGKGHEDYQVVGRTKHHFDDREEARSALEARGHASRPA
jgi:UDP-N-acetylmuramyl-tripeptide synthetase